MMTPDDLRRLATPEFNRILAADPVLAALQRESRQGSVEKANLLDALELSGNLTIGNLPVRPLTAAKLALLWVVENALIPGAESDATITDYDVFLYVLSRMDLREDISCASLAGLPAEASGLSLATGLPPEDLTVQCRTMIRKALRPLSMMPLDDADGNDEQPPTYDLDWITRVCGIAARESNQPFELCLHRMPLALVCAFYVDHTRRNAANGNEVKKRPDTVLANAIDARIDELAKDFLNDRTETEAER